jgi:hypothetical protein
MDIKNILNQLIQNLNLNYLQYNKHKYFQKNKIPKPPHLLSYTNKKDKWLFCDSEYNFKKKPHPRYLKGFDYIHNNYGYRCPDFDLENDKYKILTIGCSVSFGLGIPYEETYSYLLCKKLSEKYNLDIKNYNLSLSGVGMDYISRVLFQTIDILKPNYIILLFPDKIRLEYFENNSIFPINGSTLCLLHKIIYRNAIKSFKFLISREEYCFFNFVKNFNFINEILERRNCNWFWSCWENNFLEKCLNNDLYVKTLEKYFSFKNSDISDNFIKQFFDSKLFNPLCLGRDWAHPGREFNELFSEYLYNRIVNEKVFENGTPKGI